MCGYWNRCSFALQWSCSCCTSASLATAAGLGITGLALLHGLALFVEDLELVAGDRLAAGTRLQIVQAVRAVDVQHLGRADAVEDGQAEGVLPPPPDFRGQRLGGRDAVPDAR